MSFDIEQEALEALADAGLGTDTPGEAFILGYKAGVQRVFTQEEVDAAAMVLCRYASKEWESISDDKRFDFRIKAWSALSATRLQVSDEDD